MDFSRFSCFGTTCSIMSSQLCWKQVVESTSLFPLARFSSHSVDMYLNGIFSNPGFMTLKHSRGKSKKNAFIGACLNMLKRNFELKNAITVEQRIFRKVIPRIIWLTCRSQSKDAKEELECQTKPGCWKNFPVSQHANTRDRQIKKT